MPTALTFAVQPTSVVASDNASPLPHAAAWRRQVNGAIFGMSCLGASSHVGGQPHRRLVRHIHRPCYAADENQARKAAIKELKIRPAD
jgi:hypothetical protein